MTRWILMFCLLFPGVSHAAIPETLGWYSIPNTTLNAVCPSAVTYPNIQGNEGCRAVMDDWSGGALDPVNSRLLIWGGGHAGYAGNEVYYLDLNTLTMVRHNNPSSPINTGDCSGNNTYPDGRPVARHTYSNLAFISFANEMFAWGGSRWNCGGMGNDTWTYAPATDTWTPKSNTNGPSANHSRAAAYDPNSGLVYMRDDFNLRSYSYRANAWTNRSTSQGISTDNYKSAVIDTVRKRYYYIDPSTGGLWYYDISSPTATGLTRTAATLSGCTFDPQGGFAYDRVQDRIVGWSGGNSVVVYNPASGVCSTVTHTGGPGSQNSNGTYGRFQYVPKMNIFVVCNTTNANCYSLRLTAPLSAADQDFVNRCYGAGVVKCQGLDLSSELYNYNATNTGISAGCGSTPTIDTSVKTSGAGALKFELTGGAACANIAGWLMMDYGGATFGANSHIYVQVRQRISPEMISNKAFWRASGSRTGWKSFILHNDVSGSCANIEFTVANQTSGVGDSPAYPQTNSGCGNNLATTHVGSFPQWQAGTPYWYQQPSTTSIPSSGAGYNCEYQQPIGSGTGNGNGCFEYPTNAWWTWYLDLTIGTFGSANSTYQGYVAADGQPYRQIWNVTNWTMQCDNPCLPYNRIQLAPFQTGLTTSAPATAYTWFDEVIISTSPIAAPGQSASTPAPGAPIGLTGTGRTSGGIRF